MERIFAPEHSGKTVKYIRRQLKVIEDALSSYIDSDSLSLCTAEEQGKIIYAAEATALAARASLENTERDSGLFYEEGFERLCTKNLPVSISFDGKALIINTPLTLKRGEKKSQGGLKENYILADYVASAARVFREENPEEFQKMRSSFLREDLVFIIIRKAEKYQSRVHCDNDNIENGRIQNAVCSFLAISDSARVMDLHSCFRICKSLEETGTKFILTGLENLSLYL